MLLVEDDPNAGAAYQTILERQGHRVARASGGFEALCKLRAEPAIVRLVILDLDMPGIDGREFHRMKANAPGCLEVPIIVVSGTPQPADANQAVDIKAWLQKPVDAEALLAAVAQHSRAPG